jgi:Ca2+-binding EF-hand superfamily protein
MKIFAIAGLLVALSTGAAAQGIPPNLLADSDQDGKVSLDEYVISRRTIVMRADHDQDGKVSADEWRRAAEIARRQLMESGIEGAEFVGRGAWFLSIDADQDGFITTVEIDEVSAIRFTKLDLNGDGYIDQAEADKIIARATDK